jgi:opacity protein-like surface antigen
MNLSRVLLSSAAVIMMAGAAQAADLIVDVPATEPVAVADTGWYFSVFAGAVWDGVNSTDDINGAGDDLDVDSDMGWLLGAAVGTHLTDNVRGEVELSGTSRNSTSFSVNGGPDVDTDGTITTASLMGNVWLDLDTGSGFTPYIGGGLGIGFVSATNDDLGLDVDGVGIAYQVGAGVKFDVADNVALDLGYRFKGINADLSGEFGGGDVDDLSNTLGSHVVQVGVTFGF